MSGNGCAERSWAAGPLFVGDPDDNRRPSPCARTLSDAAPAVVFEVIKRGRPATVTIDYAWRVSPGVWELWATTRWADPDEFGMCNVLNSWLTMPDLRLDLAIGTGQAIYLPPPNRERGQR